METITASGFQSTHPSRGATGLTQQQLADAADFNPRTPRGVRRVLTLHILHSGNFNPRTPRGVRRLHGKSDQRSTYFNPRTPRGVRRSFLDLSITKSRFQSTHPSRGATEYTTFCALFSHISIHAPLAGCDAAFSASFCLYESFQSTHPSRGATSSLIPQGSAVQFQSTHPSRGATRKSRLRGGLNHAFQSTHPSRGATEGYTYIRYGNDDFNPRTPRGVRRRHSEQVGSGGGISIHAPLAGCDSSRSARCMARPISIHAPLAGCDSKT